MAAKKASGKHTNRNAKADPLGNASQNPCDPKPKLDHQSVHQMTPDDLRLAVIDRFDRNGLLGHQPVG